MIANKELTIVQHLHRLEEAFMGLLYERKRARTLDSRGNLTTCPWCRQETQMHAASKFECLTDSEFDKLTCGHCEGTSLWMFHIGYIFIRPLTHPANDFISEHSYDPD